MSQMMNNNKSYNYASKNNKKEFSIPIFVIILPIIIITLFVLLSFNIYANDNNDEVVNIGEQDTFIEENTSIIEETQVQESNDIHTEMESQEKQQKQQTNKNENTKEFVHTTDKGEKYSIIGKLDIPSLNIEYAILSSSSTELLKISLNRYWGAYPNEIGNMVVVGHNYKDNKFFSNLPKIQIGDIVKITDTEGKTLDYSVYDTSVIDPYDNSCTSQLTDGHTEITLITCYYEKGCTYASKRFVVKARAF